MGKLKSERERKLQKKLIPVNIIVCIISLVAALSLFLLPILKVDVGEMFHNKDLMNLVEEKVDEVVDKQVSESGNDDINYKPVVAVLVKDILGGIEGKVTVSALSGFRVLTGSGEKVQKVMDELFFGENALATTLIDSVAEAVANIFKTKAGKDLLEEAVVHTLAKSIITSVDNDAVTDALTSKNVKELVGIMRELENVENDDVTEVANKFVDKVNTMLGDDLNIDDENKQAVIDKIQEIYDDTKSHLDEGDKVSIEAVICVTLSESINLNDINIRNLFDGILGNKNENSANIKTVDEELGEGEGGSSEGEPEPPVEGGNEGENPPKEAGPIVTSYDGFLNAIGFDDEGRAQFKEDLRKLLHEKLDDYIVDSSAGDYMKYYEDIFYGMLVFIGPWIILFLFSFFHLFAKNKRFMMWYVKLICWIPAMIWVGFKLLPWLSTKFFPDAFEGTSGAIIKGAFSSISTFTWINGLCYVLLWLISIFWAFPIKHKIRKERKNPEVQDAGDGDDDTDF